MLVETQHELKDEPIPEDCNPEQGADYDGAGVSWGLTYKAGFFQIFLNGSVLAIVAAASRPVHLDELKCSCWCHASI